MSLTNEDKAWFADQIGVQLGAVRAELIDRMGALRAELIDRIEKTETSLLTEFHKWASPVELRQRSHSAAMRAFDAELEAVSDRVKALEGN